MLWIPCMVVSAAFFRARPDALPPSQRHEWGQGTKPRPGAEGSVCWGARGVLMCTVQGREGSYIVIRNMMAAFRESSLAGCVHVQLQYCTSMHMPPTESRAI